VKELGGGRHGASGGGPTMGLGFAGAPTFNIQNGEGSVDLFSEIIRYDNPDTYISNLGTPQYNGNISQVQWQVAGREQQAYTYKYDDLDRLLEGEYTDIHDMEGLQASGQTPYSTDNKFGEKLTYDLRGNITSLIRNGMIAPGFNAGSVVTGTFGQIDNLAYTYNTKNQVTAITDGANALKGFKGSSSTYTYDANGNLKTDAAKGITNIVYNYLNLPQTIQFTNNRKIEFVYDGTGVKLRKTTWENGIVKETRDYMENFEYKDDKIERISHSEGYITPRAKRADEGTEFVGLGGLVWQYNYVLKDHLGNTRVTFADVNNGNTIEPNTEISQINHYYPFGLNMEGNWNGASADAKNKYQYNGKELQSDFGLDWNDYGARMYDAARGQWTSVDPMAEKYTNLSSYCYVANNPINFIDPDGMQIIDNDGIVKEQKDRLNNNVKAVNEALKMEGISEDMAKSLKSYGSAMKDQLNEITTLEESSQVYNVSYGSGTDQGGGTTYNNKTKAIDINIDKNKTNLLESGVVSHELKHGYQYEKGKVSFRVENDKFGMLYDISDEVGSYNNQSVLEYGVSFGLHQWDAAKVKTMGKTMKPEAYQDIPSGSININSKIGKALIQQTIDAGANGTPVQEVYKGWEKDYEKGQKSKKGN
jgi:RHS repeat-associated protein